MSEYKLNSKLMKELELQFGKQILVSQRKHKRIDEVVSWDDENELNEDVSVFDERHFGKNGIIIMINNNGTVVSAIFKDKKNADKYDRNKQEDIEELLALAKKTKYPKAIDENAVEMRESTEETYVDGYDKITVKVSKNGNKTTVEYFTEDFEEPISKELLRQMKRELGDFTFITNAGLELHSTEVKNGKWEGITIKKQMKETEEYAAMTEANTPWGKSDQEYKIQTGVVWYMTPGHGGLYVSPAVAKKMLSPQAIELGEKYGNGYWYEEDIAWAIPCYEHPEWINKFAELAGGKTMTKDEMKDSIERWFPEYFDEEFIAKAAKKQHAVQNMPQIEPGDLLYFDNLRVDTGIVLGKTKKGRTDIVVIRGDDYNRYGLRPNHVKNNVVKVERDKKIIWER